MCSTFSAIYLRSSGGAGPVDAAVNTPAKANTVVIKDYVKDTTLAGKTIHDVDTLTVTYYLN